MNYLELDDAVEMASSDEDVIEADVEEVDNINCFEAMEDDINDLFGYFGEIFKPVHTNIK